MALARGILVWLPLETLVPLLWARPKLLGENPIQTRGETVNRLGYREQIVPLLEELKGGLFEPFDNYLKICTFQGELSEYALLFVDVGYLIERAVFLDDVEWFQYFSSFAPEKINLDSLAGSAPEIWAWTWALFLGTRKPYHLLRLKDLAILDETRLRGWYLDLLDDLTKWSPPSEEDRLNFSRIAGYLGWGNFRELIAANPAAPPRYLDWTTYRLYYIEGRQHFGQEIDGEAVGSFTDATAELMKVGYQIKSSGGQVPGLGLQKAMDYFQADWLLKHMDQAMLWDHVIPVREFTQKDARLAEAMLQGEWKFGPLYLASVLIVAGQEVNPDWIAQQSADNVRKLQQLMYSVGHPDAVPGLVTQSSRIMYDAAGMLQKLGQAAPARALQVIFSRGEALAHHQAYREWMPGQTPFERSEHMLVNTVIAEYGRHYKKLIMDYKLPLNAGEIETIRKIWGASRMEMRPAPEIARIQEIYQEILTEL